MKQLEIFGENRFKDFTKTRIGCRGIVVADGKILVSREEKTDYWLIPGGGLETGETLEACCVREILEETGYIIKPIKQFLLLNEYYEAYRYVSHYFICEMTGVDKQNRTAAEIERGLIPKWMDIQDFLKIVSGYAEHAAMNREKRNAYLREYTALCVYLEL